jgi:phenylacetate-CoA ligase
MLLPHQRELIEEVFKCRIFNSYGCGDGGGSALECSEHNGLHIPIQRTIMEFVDDKGEPVSAGQEGRIVLTDPFNYSMPFIRYEVGDIGIPSTEICPCGRGLPLIKSLGGRTTDIIRFRDGTTLSGPAFTLIFREFPIKQYQVVQTDLDNLLIRVVKEQSYVESDSERLLGAVKYHMGCQGNVRVEFVDDITITRAGKRLCFISNVEN